MKTITHTQAPNPGHHKGLQNTATPKGLPNRYAVTMAKVVYIPVIDKDDPDHDDRPPRFAKTGIRIELANGEWWFISFLHGTYTRHRKGLAKRYRSLSVVCDNAGNPEYEDEKVTSYKDLNHVMKGLGHCPVLVVALVAGRERALMDDQRD